MHEHGLQHRIEAVRQFNRFYTRQIGVLREGLLSSPFSLTQARVIYELAHHGQCTASALSGELGLDPGYISRILRGFKSQGLIDTARAENDGRQSLIRLSEAGQAAFALLNERSRNEIAALLQGLPDGEQSALVDAMHAIERILSATPERPASILLRPHQVGDLGWIVHRHGALYGEEYGWDQTFEAMVAKVAAAFITGFKAGREFCWMAELSGAVVGSVVLVQHSKTVAQLRLLLVEPHARGHGIGDRLVQQCITQARQCGYRRIRLWTNDVLVAARRLYQRHGFELIESEPHHSFGHDLVGEIWERELRRPVS